MSWKNNKNQNENNTHILTVVFYFVCCEKEKHCNECGKTEK